MKVNTYRVKTKPKKEPNIRPIMRQVWYAPTARRHFFSKHAACVGEARAIIKAKYPSEEGEYENGYCVYPGWSWHEIPRSGELLKRFARRISKKTKTRPARG